MASSKEQFALVHSYFVPFRSLSKAEERLEGGICSGYSLLCVWLQIFASSRLLLGVCMLGIMVKLGHIEINYNHTILPSVPSAAKW